MGYKKGDTVNISDAFESYGLANFDAFNAVNSRDTVVYRRLCCWVDQ